MSFNQLDYLEQGKVYFISQLSIHDYNELIKNVRNSKNKINIINGFLPKLKRIHPRFCFEIIYDIDEYVKDLFDFIKGTYGYKVGYINLINDNVKIRNILNNTTWGRDFVFRNLTNIIRANDDNIYVILDYVFKSFYNNLDFIKRLSRYDDLHIRYIFMKYLIEKFPDKIDFVYDDIIKYLGGYNYLENEQLTFFPKLMSSRDISDLAITVFNSNLDNDLWERLKEYILTNYKSNNLASLLLEDSYNRNLNVIEFSRDADRLFNTANGYKINIYHNYSKYISLELLKQFKRYLSYFEQERKGMDYTLYSIFKYGLWDELEEYIDKYLALSKRADFRFLAEGSTTSCYKIGDYVFKLNRLKWSCEDVICPNLYLILKNLEEHYVRDNSGKIVVGIEVQKYLSRKDINITPEHLIWFQKELRRLGYYSSDMLMYGPRGDNCMLLDSYMDADHPNPELLPEAFKQVPLVIVDRDMIYKVKKKRPKLR